MATHYEDKEYVLDTGLKEIEESTATLEQIAEYKIHKRNETKV